MIFFFSSYCYLTYDSDLLSLMVLGGFWSFTIEESNTADALFCTTLIGLLLSKPLIEDLLIVFSPLIGSF